MRPVGYAGPTVNRSAMKPPPASACRPKETPMTTAKRHPGTEHLLSLFASDHLPDHLALVSVTFATVADNMVRELGDGPELSTGLRKLLEAKDCFVRQAVIDHRNGGDLAERTVRVDNITVNDTPTAGAVGADINHRDRDHR